MTKDKVLSMLEQGRFVSGREMGEKLGLSRAAIWKCMQTLKAEGYVIESVTNRGYRLVTAVDRLMVTGLPDAVVLSEVDSTNTYAKQLAEQGAPHGTMVISDCQTGGRGRMGRTFASPKGVGVYFSVIYRPKVPPTDLLHLTAVAGVVGAEAVEQVCGRKPAIKWTNDLLFGGKKVAGILTEMSLEAESATVNYAIVGIGINCNQLEFPAELAEIATSIAMETGETIDRNQLAEAMGRGFLAAYDTMWTEKSRWMAEYAQNCMTLGQDVRVVRGNESRLAKALELDQDGGLLVAYEDGTKAVVNSGEVSVRGYYGYA